MSAAAAAAGAPVSPTAGDVDSRPIFDGLSATRLADGTIVVSGHVHHDGGAYPTPVVRLDDFDARMLATTLTALLERRPRLEVAA